MRLLIDLASLSFVVFWVYKVVVGLSVRRRMLWAGSVPITDQATRDRYTEIWWETYAVIDPADRVNHAPTPHWWIYQDHHFLPTYLGQRLIGWWAKEQRAIFVTEASKDNRNLIRHECAHDIMDSIGHSAKYFGSGTYVMKQFQ